MRVHCPGLGAGGCPCVSCPSRDCYKHTQKAAEGEVEESLSHEGHLTNQAPHPQPVGPLTSPLQQRNAMYLDLSQGGPGLE